MPARNNWQQPAAVPASNRCSGCTVGDLCVAMGSDETTLSKLDELLRVNESIPLGKEVLETGEKFHGLYAVRSGCFKSSVLDREGREQVQGFHFTGELIGLEGISTGRYAATVSSLTDAALCRFPYEQLLSISATSDSGGLQKQLFHLFSDRLANQNWRTADFSASERVVLFLLDISERQREREQDAHSFELPMSRSDIGNYLGLATETVSRIFTRLRADGLIDVRRKRVMLLDAQSLKDRAEVALGTLPS